MPSGLTLVCVPRSCEGYAGCGGFSLEMGTQTECWYISDTRLYVDTAPGEYCYTYRFNATSVDVAAEVRLPLLHAAMA